MPTIWSRDRMRLATPGRLYASTTALKQFAAPNWRQSLTYWGWHVLSRTHRSDPCYDQLGAESLRPFRNFVDWPRLLWGCVHNMCGIFVIIAQQQGIFTASHRTHCFWQTNSKDSSCCSYLFAGNWNDSELINESEIWWQHNETPQYVRHTVKDAGVVRHFVVKSLLERAMSWLIMWKKRHQSCSLNLFMRSFESGVRNQACMSLWHIILCPWCLAIVDTIMYT